MKNIKYRFSTEVLKDFILAINPRSFEKIRLYNSMTGQYVLQPIPLTAHRLRLRGFNQANSIGLWFHKYLNFPIVDLISKSKESRPQAEIRSNKERSLNVKDVFKLKPAVKPGFLSKHRVILVDDVVTTGSTVKEAARILKKAGCDKIFVLTLARG